MVSLPPFAQVAKMASRESSSKKDRSSSGSAYRLTSVVDERSMCGAVDAGEGAALSLIVAERPRRGELYG